MLVGATKSDNVNCTSVSECDGLFRWMHDASVIRYNASWWNDTDMHAVSVAHDVNPESCVGFINSHDFKGLEAGPCDYWMGKFLCQYECPQGNNTCYEMNTFFGFSFSLL